MPLPTSFFVEVNINLQAGSVDRFDFNALLGVFDHSVTVNRIDGPYTSLAEVEAAGFTVVAEPEVYYWAQSVFSQQNPGIERVYIGREDAADANWTATMDAIAAAGGDDFYFINIESRVQADIEEVAAWAQARPLNLYIAQSADADILAGTPANVALELQAATYSRAALIYHATSSGSADGYLDGAWTSYCGGFRLDEPAGVGSWNYNELAGVNPDSFTSAQASEVLDADCNLFQRKLGRNFTWEGTLASGNQIDVTTTTDWFTRRVEEALLNLFVSTTTRIPYTDAGITRVAQQVIDIQNQGVRNGHFVETNLVVPRLADISTADREAGVLRLTASNNFMTLAGQIRRVVATFNVSF